MGYAVFGRVILREGGFRSFQSSEAPGEPEPPIEVPDWSLAPTEFKINSADGVSGDEFGRSVQISLNGSTSIIGAPKDDSSRGSAYIFIHNGTIWVEQSKLVASDGAAGDSFGYSVSISNDGNTAVIGAYQDDTTLGSAYVFVRTGSTWTQQAKLLALDGVAGDAFGFSVAISSDGNTAVIASYQDDSSRGSAYIFTRSGPTWTQQAKLVAADGAAGDGFGHSVAITNDGNMVAIGAMNDDITTTDQGSVYVFTRSGSTWTQQARLSASDPVNTGLFGKSVALNSDGSTLLVGSYYSNSFKGSAYVFTRSGSTWTQQAKLTAPDGLSDDYYGYSVALSSNGDIAVVGSSRDDNALEDSGSAYVYTRTDSTWTQVRKLSPAVTIVESYFGASSSINSSGNKILVGGYKRATGNAYIYESQ